MSPAYSSRVEHLWHTFTQMSKKRREKRMRKKDAKKDVKKDAKKDAKKRREKQNSNLQSKLIPAVLLYDLIPHMLF